MDQEPVFRFFQHQDRDEIHWLLPVSKKFSPNLILLRIDNMEVINEHEAG